MLSANFLDLPHEVACLMKKCKAAFGGVMIILVGDVAHLPPVAEFHEAPSSEGPNTILVRSMLLRAASGRGPSFSVIG